MKHLILAALLVSGLASASAQSISYKKDSTTNHKGKFTWKFHTSEEEFDRPKSKDDSAKLAKANKGRFVGGLTFTRIDIGYMRLIDNGSFTLSPENEFLDYRGGKTSMFSFDIVQLGYRFNQNFKIAVAGGFDWTHIRLNKDITIQKNTPVLTYIEEPADFHFEKNRFSSSYIHIPLNFEFRTNENDNGKRFYFVAGPEVSFLLNGKVKQISQERGKVKVKDDYRFQAFRTGGTVRFGYDGLGFFTKYYFNDMFASTPQKGLTNMAFGITLGLN
ncbi:outer membrane beta-barrel protein [Pedobacter metabolipauper]|uniref:Outer membrane protein with beta-barrel domain n=1 Tax=Pedobacter metabolipauper TaxID=425513 RepID=A0A4R6STF3_9SPHI|nr:outer membrane beta-barrel protein [Pedobacter metabolipauper]TDQ08725.1 outer membrane protein with beta-barrel domain [Pedobacter metabolipauper]